jgi:hypothetical protein
MCGNWIESYVHEVRLEMKATFLTTQNGFCNWRLDKQCVCVFFCEFSQPYKDKNMETVKGTKCFVLEKKGLSCHIRYEGKKILRSPYLENSPNKSPNYNNNPKIF